MQSDHLTIGVPPKLSSKDLLQWDQTLFKDERYFELDYVPEHFSHRETQMRALQIAVRPALRGARPINSLCSGPHGTGKTTAVLKVFEEIEEFTSSVVPVYVNCQIDGTRFAVFSEIYKKLFNYTPPDSGVSFKRVFKKITKYLIDQEKVLIVALDDINYLFYENTVNKVLYALLRAHEVSAEVKVGVIAISSDLSVELSKQLDPRVMSVFLPEEIYFPLYTRVEVRDILEDRVRHGFYANVVPADVLEKVIDLVEEASDLRVGIDLLRKTGLRAEMNARRGITADDVEHSFEKSRLVHLTYSIQSLRGEERELLKLIAEQEEKIRAGDLYAKFNEATHLGYTRFYDIVSKLDSIRLINTDFTGRGTRGRTREIRLRYDPIDVLSVLTGTDK
jgi:cell division control protein 6